MLKRYTTSYSVPALSAGASGYWQISVSVSGQIVSINVYTANIAYSGGLQLTPIHITGDTLYVNYYAPSAIAAGKVTLSVNIDYNV